MRLITILIFLTGLGLFSYSLTLPYYKGKELTDNMLEYDDKEEYYKRKAELATSKTTFMDLGAGIAIFSVTILVFLLLTKSKKFSDLKNVNTFNRLLIFISANIVWLLLLPGTFWYYSFRGERGDYPPFADSIGIPIATTNSLSFVFAYSFKSFSYFNNCKNKFADTTFYKGR